MTVETTPRAEPLPREDLALIGTLNPDQRACVTNVGGPLLVCAGAGSGKTFMLTRRIAYALLHPELSGVREIDQDVLAITFTELAAAEIKSRVRSTLRSIGMVDAALKVDSSWISTIHGMCSRILHEHALELGLDPAFGLIDDTDRNRLLAEGVDEALSAVSLAGGRRGNRRGEDDEEVRPADGRGDADDEDADGEAGAGSVYAEVVAGEFRALFSEYGIDAVKAMVFSIVNEAAGVRGGLDAVEVGPPARAPREIARDVHQAMVQAEGAAHLLGIDAKGRQDKFAQRALDSFRDAETGIPRFERLAASAETGLADLAEALGAHSPKFAGNTVGRSAEKRAAYDDWLLAYDRACRECMAGLAERARDELLELARLALAAFERKKAARGVLDQNDLLVKTLDAFETNERVADEFRDKFKLVMVDEFQDTSALQIAIIGFLDGPGGAHLCTVGDTQQSIYRFRGADVDTYRAHKRHMRGEVGADYRELGVNYRSHGDVITFVNRLFSQDRAFGTGAGSEFIELGFNPDRPSSIPAGCPRIDATFVVGPNPTRKDPAPNSAELVSVAAHVVCDRFVAYHEAGVAWRDMVVLLGAMSNAGVYAGELRAHGIPCVIAGGSIFDRAPESRTVCALARCLANPLDDDALLDVLASDMFGLDPDELLAIATDDAGRRRAHLWHGLRGFADGGPTPRLHLAAHTLRTGVSAARRVRPSVALMDAVLESGWLDRLYETGPEGTAQAANILKCVRLAESLEGDPRSPRGAAGVAERMATKFAEGMKEAPGALNTTGSDAVRIMTIHASKGLEFPVVALGEFWRAGVDRGGLSTETVGETVFLSLKPGRSVAKGGRFEDLKKRVLAKADRARMRDAAAERGDGEPVAENPAEAPDAAGFASAVAEHADKGELAEMRRKFYVGATRPREALVVVCHAKQTKAQLARDPEEPRSFSESYELLEDLACALSPSGMPVADAPQGIEFGGSQRAICRMIQLEIDGEEQRSTGERHVRLVGKPLSDYLLSDTLGSQAYRAEAAAIAASPDGPALPTTWADYTRAAGGDQPVEDAVVVPEPVDIRGLLPPDIPCNPLRANTFSYSSIARHGEEAGSEGDAGCDPDELAREGGSEDDAISFCGTAPQPDSPEAVEAPVEAPTLPAGKHNDGGADRGHAGDAPRKAAYFDPTSFGSSFHTAAQLMAEAAARRGAGGEAWSVPAVPGPERLAAIARTWGLPEAALPRLVAALDRWRGSDVAREAYSHDRVVGEAPFYVTLLGPQGEPLHMEGSIDLLCTHGAPPACQRALVVDYKTGGSAAEDPGALHEKHLLQAQCYAYAVLLHGYAGVDLAFVRVEVEDGAEEGGGGAPQVVRYSFDARQLDDLAMTIRDAYRAAGVSR